MNRHVFAFFPAVVLALYGLAATAVQGQSLPQDLQEFVAIPAVPGYEQTLQMEIRQRLEAFSSKVDNLGDILVTIGSGFPHRLIVTPVDEPGYVVSGITEEGYLRVQRLPQAAPNPLFDNLYESQPVRMRTSDGRWVDGVVAGLSTHLQPARRNAPTVSHPDDLYVDIGASSPAEVHRAGVDVLDPLSIDRQLEAMAGGKLAGASAGDRFGAAALVELARRLDPRKIEGTLTLAFVTEQWTGARGLQRVMELTHPDEMVFVGRFSPGRAGADRRGILVSPRREPGSGVLIASVELTSTLAGFSGELQKLADTNQIPAVSDISGPLIPSGYVKAPTLPERLAHVGIAIAWPATPAEMIDGHDLENLASLLEAYARGSSKHESWPETKAQGEPPVPSRPKAAPAMPALLKALVEVYGVSGSEGMVRAAVAALLPSWAKPNTDSDGNLVLQVGSGPASAKTQRILVVAHLDEIGFAIKSIGADGRLEVEWLGGGISSFFAGHPILVHTTKGIFPGVLELPANWNQPDFQWPANREVLRADIGARSAEEVEKLGIHVRDWITVRKKYRPLAGTRANGRSFDDRVGCAALIAAVWSFGGPLEGRDVTFIWSTGEEVGLVGAFAAAQRLAAAGQSPDYVFAVDTFVSADSPLESLRFADAPVGRGFVLRAVDNSNIVPTELADRLIRMAKESQIPAQYGVTGGGNDGSAFLRFGARDVALGWPLRYSHSPGEVIDVRDAEALGRIVAVVSRSW